METSNNQRWEGLMKKLSTLVHVVQRGAVLATALLLPIAGYGRSSASGATPSTVIFTLLTPPAARIAGDTIVAVVKISNNDGLVSGSYCYSGDSAALYRDTLGKGSASQPAPTITTSQGSTILNAGTDASITTPECFTNGVDTVKGVLYNAPYTDTLHQLSVNPKGVTAVTEPFKLLPGDLYTLSLESATGVHLTGTDTLVYPNGHTTIYSIGYDRYGNGRGRESSDWSVTNTLHPLTQSSNISVIYYDASNAAHNESGLVIARAARFVNGVFQDSLAADSLGIVIIGPPSSLDSAVTRDVNGGGYLDEIELYFNKPITILPSTGFTVTAGGTVFPVDSLGGVAGAGAGGETGTHFVVYLHEQQNGIPQTAWRPLVSIWGIQGAPDINNLMTKDGAGPVIWMVVKTINNPQDRKQDVVTVIFSEPIAGQGGSQFVWSTVKPSDVFSVYRLNAAQTGYDTLSTMLDSIVSFTQMVNDSTLRFSMTNGNDITTNDYMNIKVAAGQIFDARGNAPVFVNRKALVAVAVGIAAGALHVAPFVKTTQSRAGFVVTFGGYPAEQVSATVRTVQGKMVQRLSLEHGSGFLLWPYSDLRGNRVSNGLYLIEIRAGEKLIRQKVLVTG